MSEYTGWYDPNNKSSRLVGYMDSESVLIIKVNETKDTVNINGVNFDKERLDKIINTLCEMRACLELG